MKNYNFRVFFAGFFKLLPKLSNFINYDGKIKSKSIRLKEVEKKN